jgi:hypothetical protein
MFPRPFWRDRLVAAWEKVPIAWLAGVRRVGKTTLARAFPDATFVNCDLPSMQRALADPEQLLASVKTPKLILDEVHQLHDPAGVLKIAADEHPRLRVLATGSSTLDATRKFRDSLTGRKRTIHLTPVLPEECQSFGVADLRRRLMHGGLPDALLASKPDPEFYSEWADSFYARDLHELFAVEKRQPFMQLLDWLLRSNGTLVETTEMARATGLSRPTVIRYLEALEVTQVVTVLRPFHDGAPTELVKQPKVYAFDTGFVCHARGWGELRPEDAGHLLENLALESLQASLRKPKIHFWRTKQRQEVDFVVPLRAGIIDAVECKWSSSERPCPGLRAFREAYPRGRNWLVCGETTKSHTRRSKDVTVRVVNIRDFRREFDEGEV